MMGGRGRGTRTRGREVGRGSRKGKPIFWPVLVLRECLKVSSEGILQMWSGTLDLIYRDKEQGGNCMNGRQKGSGQV